MFSVAAAETKGQAGSWDIYCSIRSESRDGQKNPSAAQNGKEAEMWQNPTITVKLL